MKTRTALFASALLAATFVNAQDLAAIDPAARVDEAAPTAFDMSATERLELELDKQIDRYVTYPYVQREALYGAVVVTYVVDAEGKLRVMTSEATDQRLLDHVLAKLERIDVGENPSGLWTKTTARFVFMPQQ